MKYSQSGGVVGGVVPEVVECGVVVTETNFKVAFIHIKIEKHLKKIVYSRHLQNVYINLVLTMLS